MTVTKRECIVQTASPISKCALTAACWSLQRRLQPIAVTSDQRVHSGTIVVIFGNLVMDYRTNAGDMAGLRENRFTSLHDDNLVSASLIQGHFESMAHGQTLLIQKGKDPKDM